MCLCLVMKCSRMEKWMFRSVLGSGFLSPLGVKPGGRESLTSFLLMHGEEPVLGGTVKAGGRWPQTVTFVTFKTFFCH